MTFALPAPTEVGTTLVGVVVTVGIVPPIVVGALGAVVGASAPGVAAPQARVVPFLQAPPVLAAKQSVWTQQ